MATILIIDYSETVLSLTRERLVAEGHDVVVTSSGRHALALLQTDSFDLAIAEIFMPELDGLELLREARAFGLSVAFVAMSSQPDGSNLFKIAKFLGAAATLQKPFTTDELDRAITTALAPRITTDGDARPGALLKNQTLSYL